MSKIVDRIKQIIKQKHLTNTQFAESIEVDKGSIAHILSGRNNPSLKVITHIHATYPEYTLDWLIKGVVQTKETHLDFSPEKKIIETSLIEEVSGTKKNKTITKVIIIYSDGSTEDLQK